MGLDTSGVLRWPSLSLSIYLSIFLPSALSANVSARLRCPYWSPCLRAVCLVLTGPPRLPRCRRRRIIIRLLRDDYPTVRGCNTRNKRAVSRCGGSDDKPNKSSVHLAPHGETHVRTSVLRKRDRCLVSCHPLFVRVSSRSLSLSITVSLPSSFFTKIEITQKWKTRKKLEASRDQKNRKDSQRYNVRKFPSRRRQVLKKLVRNPQ